MAWLGVPSGRRWLMGLWLATLLAAVASLLLSTSFVGHHFAGFRTDIGCMVSVNRADDWPDTFQLGDMIESVAGLPVPDRASLLAAHDRARVGEILVHRLYRNGRLLTVPAVVRVYTWADWFNPLAPFLAYAVVIAALGLFIAAKADGRPETMTLSAFCALFALGGIVGASLDLFLPLSLLEALVCGAMTGLILSLALQLGRDRRVRWRLILASTALLVALAVVVPDRGIAAVGLAAMQRNAILWQAALIYLPLAGIVAFIPLMIRNLWQSEPDSLAAQQQRVVLLGAVAAFGPVAVVWGQPLVTGRVWNALTNASLFCLILFPAAICVAVLRFRLFEIEILLRRTLVYALYAGILTVTYFGGVSLLAARLGDGHREEVRLLFFLAIVLVAEPLRQGLLGRLDHRFGRSRLAPAELQRRLQDHASGRVRDVRDLAGVAADLKEALQLTCCGIALVVDGQVSLAAGDVAASGGWALTDLPSAERWERGAHPDFAWPEGVMAALKVIQGDQLIALLLLGGKRSQEPLQAVDYDYLALMLGQIGLLVGLARLHGQAPGLEQEMTRLLAQVDGLNDLQAQFGLVASQELRTPLTVIQSYAEALLDGEHDGLAPDQRQFLQQISESAQLLSRRLNLYLDFAALRAGHLQVCVEPFGIAALLAEVVEHCQPLAAGEEIGIDLDVTPGLRARGDRRRLGRTLQQLLAAAVADAPVGGLVKVQACRAGDAVLIALPELVLPPTDLEPVGWEAGEPDVGSGTFQWRLAAALLAAMGGALKGGEGVQVLLPGA